MHESIKHGHATHLSVGQGLLNNVIRNISYKKNNYLDFELKTARMRNTDHQFCFYKPICDFVFIDKILKFSTHKKKIIFSKCVFHDLSFNFRYPGGYIIDCLALYNL